MRKIFWIVIVSTATVALAWWLAGLPGAVTVVLFGYTVKAASSLALVGLVVALAVLYAVLRVLSWAWHTPRRIGFWRRRRQRAGGDDAITRTLVAIAAGVEGDARREAAKARRLLGDTPQTLLLAAEAGRLANREDEAAELYNTLAERGDAALLGLRGLFRQAMNREAWDEAAAIAARAERAHPGAAWLRDERAQLALRTGNWAQALRLSGANAPKEAFATAAAEAAINPDEALRLAKRAWKDNPGFAPAALTYARRLRATGKESKALQVIREAWSANPNPELAAFAMEAIQDMAARVQEAVHIIGATTEHQESQFLLARLSFDAGQLNDARHHLDRARRAGLNQKRLWLLLADIEIREHGDTEAGQAAQRDALRQAAMAEPDPAWRCEACGTEHSQWQPVCRVCHTGGRVRWGVRQAALLAS